MNSSSSESESSSNDEFLSRESIKSRETGLPNVYRLASKREMSPEDDEEIIEIMNSSHDDELEEVDKVLSRAVPSKEKSQSSMEEIVNELANSTTLDECVICLDGITEGELVKNELCDCVFVYHSKCYYEWINNSKKNTCLLCKQPIIVTNNIITNTRIMDILDNKYKQTDSNIQEGTLNIINRPVLERESNNYYSCIDFIYNYNLKRMEIFLYILLIIWGFLMVFIILLIS